MGASLVWDGPERVTETQRSKRTSCSRYHTALKGEDAQSRCQQVVEVSPLTAHVNESRLRWLKCTLAFSCQWVPTPASNPPATPPNAPSAPQPSGVAEASAPHSDEGSRCVERMLTVTSILRAQARSLLAFQCDVMNGWLHGTPFISVLPMAKSSRPEALNCHHCDRCANPD